MGPPITRKRLTPSMSKNEPDINESDTNGVPLREGKNPTVRGRRYEHLLASCGIYMDDDHVVAPLEGCQATCQKLLYKDQRVH